MHSRQISDNTRNISSKRCEKMGLQYLEVSLWGECLCYDDGQFLFELPSRKVAEHVQSGKWVWKKMKLKLEWWNPTTGCWPEEIRRDWVWIRMLGLPLSM
ncbi:hypothetical protein BC332_17165 [Capsicum chinense]|nr:hypothetical protein BC332_17165 [Capsicum chinense]